MSFAQLQQNISPKFTEEVLQTILFNKSGLSDIKIDKITLGAESKKGDSYLSNICRFSVDITGKNTNGLETQTSVHVIVKSLLSNVGRRKTFRGMDFFENESIFYNTVWSTLDAFQKSKVPSNQQFTSIPLLLASHIDGEHDFIAMDDLSFQGYTGAGRDSGLDFNTTITILHTFAHFHGLALACKQQTPEMFENAAIKLKEVYFDEKIESWYTNFQKNLLIILKDAVAKELPDLYLKKLNDFITEDLYKKICKICRIRGPLSVITHGDAWVPNFLMKYGNENKPEKVAMIDFQLARYTNLATDITFFLFSCVSPDVLQTKFDDFIIEYHKELSNAVKKFGGDVSISLDDIYKSFKEIVPFTVGMSLEAIVMSLLDDDEVSDLDAIQGDEAVPLESVWVVKPMQDPIKRQRLAGVFKIIVDKQWL